MSLNRTTKSAVDEKKLRESLTFNQGKLRNLEKLSVDPTIAGLLTKVNGEITLSLTGKTCNVVVDVEEFNGRKTSVSVEEFLRVLAAPGRIKNIAKQQQVIADTEKVRTTIANYLFAFEKEVADFQPITSDIFGLIKQSFALAKRVHSNIEIADVIILKHPNDPLGPYLHQTLNLCLQVVIGGIVSLITRERSVSESNSKLMADYHLPAWSYNRFTREAINKESTPYGVFFPRKKGKGITCTTRELGSQDFRNANSYILVNSRLLIGIVHEDRTFLNAAIGLTAAITDDDVAEEMFQKHPWHVFPPLEGDVDRFLELKGKAVAEVLPDAPKADLKKRLAKVDNALLRTSLLENSGMKPDVVICQRLFPASATNFDPMDGVDIYEALRAEPDIEAAILDFMQPNDVRFSNMWAELVTLELKIPNSAQIRNSFRDIFEVTTAVADRINTIVPNLAEFEAASINRQQNLFPAGFAREGSPNLATIVALRGHAFSLIDQDERVGRDDEKKKRPIPNTSLMKSGRNLVNAIKKGINEEASEGIRDFLCGFTSPRLQEEAAIKVAAASNRDLHSFLTMEDDEDPDDGDDEEGEGIDFVY